MCAPALELKVTYIRAARIDGQRFNAHVGCPIAPGRSRQPRQRGPAPLRCGRAVSTLAELVARDGAACW